jgi:hypothetical protein
MEKDLNQKQLNLLTELCGVLQNPNMPSLLGRLKQHPFPQPLEESEGRAPQSKPSLLQRMDVSGFSNNSKSPPILSGDARALKLTLTPQSFESSMKTLLSCLHQPKRRRLSTPISRKSCPSNHPVKSPEIQEIRGNNLSTPHPQEKTYCCTILGEFGNVLFPKRGTKMREILRGRNSTSPTCPGTQIQQLRPLVFATPVARKPVSFFEHTTATSPRPSSLIAHNSPTGIPSSQWERNLKGIPSISTKSSRHSTILFPDEERTGRLGDTEITFGVVEPKKCISSAAEWSAAWRRALKAICFAFTHRRDELIEYGDYIVSEFAAKIVSSYHKLLLYDIALRNEVSAGQHILLTDHHWFSRLYSAIVMPDGVESTTDKLSGKKPGKPGQGNEKSDICNKFNAGTCRNNASDCKYRHVCKICNKPGHRKGDCSDKSK